MDAVVGMVFYSISLAFGPIAMITSIGMVLPSDYIGTGLGLYKASNNSKSHLVSTGMVIIDNPSYHRSWYMHLGYYSWCNTRWHSQPRLHR